MKNIKNIFSIINKIFLKLSLKNADITGSTFFNVRIQGSSTGNKSRLLHSKLENTRIIFNGQNNILCCEKSEISNSNITITGQGNRLLIQPGVKLRASTVIIRGDNCTIKIGSKTTFGGVRIINVGSYNEINIGAECLFSDNIELWSSDTHPIFNEEGLQINRDKPVKIGNHVWVGSRVIILKGVNVGDGSIIGMGSLVNKDIPPNVISAGFPSRTIKEKVNWKIE